MTRDTWLAAGITVALVAIYAGSGADPSKAPQPPRTNEAGFGDAWRQRVVDEITKGGTVRAATWSSGSSLWAGVIDDGSKRDGLARSICETVNERRLSADDRVTVRVWDVAKMTIADEMKELGRHDCYR